MSGQTIRLVCPNLKCRRILVVPANTRGKTIRCSACGTAIRVPDQRPAAPADAAESKKN